MATKYQFISALYKHTVSEITKSPTAWMEFLQSACRNYKCRFDEQVLIYAQRPDATAVLEIEKWNKGFGRWVNRGATGIAVFDDKSIGNRKLKHYFDVSDTHETNNSRTVPIWNVKTEHESEIIESLGNSFGGIGENVPLSTALFDTTNTAVVDNIHDYLDQLLNSHNDTNTFNIETRCRALVTKSVSYMLLTRCGIDTSEHFTPDDFKYITNFNTPETINTPGLASSDIAEMILREISTTVISLQNRTFAETKTQVHNIPKNIDRRQSNDLDIPKRGRLHDSEPDVQIEASNNPWQIRVSPRKISERTQASIIHKSADNRKTDESSLGDRTDIIRDDRANNHRDGFERRLDRGLESERPDDMDGLNEQYPEVSGGNSNEQPDLHINLPTVEEQLSLLSEAEADTAPSAFSISQQIIDEILTSGATDHNSTKRIAGYFKKDYEVHRNAEFLQNIYQTDSKGFIFNENRVSIWFDKNGMKIAVGDTVRIDNHVLITWEQAATRIRELLDLGRYMPQSELDIVDDYEFKRLAELIWYLKRDCADESEFSFIDSKIINKGFPDSTAQITELLKDPNERKVIQNGILEFAEAVEQDNSLLRFRFAFNTLNETVARLADLEREQLTFTADETVTPMHPSFITQDDISHMLINHGGYDKSKYRIYAYFLQNHTATEKANFLKKDYGTMMGSAGAGRSKMHNNKGIEYSRGDFSRPYDKIMLTWSDIAKRIDGLIAENRYMTKEELDGMSSQPNKILNLSLGATVYLGIEEYEISAFNNDRVLLFDPTAPLFQVEMPRPEFDKKVAENPMNDGLFVPSTEEVNINSMEQIRDELFSHDYAVSGELVEDALEEFNPQNNDGNKSIADHLENEYLTESSEPELIPTDNGDAIIPSWEQSKSKRVQAIGLYPDIPMSERHNFKITDDELGAGGQKAKYKANIEAIRTLQTIENEQRLATPDEQKILSRYVGWGSLQQAFDENNPSWTNEHAELKDLLANDEYAAARASTLNAFYTTPIVIKAIYKAVENIGFKTGNILEPSCGVGNFIGLLPESMHDSKVFGIELDSITGRIAQQLYQKSNIAVQGFETTNLPDSFFDVAIGNVPFGAYKVPDKKYDKHNFNIHDYFFAKTLDKVRPGGVIAFITSMYMMDKQDNTVRKYIAQRAELLGAIRLPNNTFLKNAGTSVTTDIIFLQKRDRVVAIEPDWVHLDKTEEGFAVNSYFTEHPEMILGTLSNESGTRMYGSHDSLSCIPFEDADLSELLEDAITNIHAKYSQYERSEDNLEDNSIPADPTVRNFSYTLVDGHIFYRQDSRMIPAEMSLTAQNRVKGLIELRECIRTLIVYQTESYPDSYIINEQTKLNRLYDNFTKKYGLINSRGNSMAFAQDSAYSLLCALEILDENGELERKADMFSKRTIKPNIPITHVDTAVEALAASLSEKGRVDIQYMSQLSSISEDELDKELEGLIFLNIEATGMQNVTYVTADEYLSGNVREKLRYAKVAAKSVTDGSLDVNVKALEAVIPRDLTAGEISVKLGTTWIPQDVIEQFMHKLFETSWHAKGRIKVHYSHYTGSWNITNKNADRSNIHTFNTYGTQRMSAYHIMENTLNLRDVRIFDKEYDSNGNEKRVLNKKETAIAMAKQDIIRGKFEEWIWKDPERRESLCRLYNDKFNSIRPRAYDGSHLAFPAMNPEIKLRKHQIDAIARILYGGNTLLAHVVGAGKTFEMVTAAMESKRLGLCNKSLFVVPNHITEQWAGEFLQLYPSANILVATKKDFETRNRKKFCARIATGDYDAVIIGHSQFEKIPISLERQKAMLESQIEELVLGIEELRKNNGERLSIKQLERLRKSIENKLAKLNDQSRKDDVVTFEELGINRLFIDEAHYYKNLYLVTKMRNVGGITQTEAQKSSDLYAKCRYLDEETNGRGIIFATGTPISNSMVEMYTMQRYLQYDVLRENNLQHFDAWASTFGETVTAIELAPEGTGYRAKTRFAKFHNLPELMSMFRSVADVQTADMLKLPVPDANFHTEVLKPSEWQKSMISELAERADTIRSGGVNSAVDNMLKVTNDGRKLALDQRIINPMLPDDPESKVAKCAENVFTLWEQHKEKRLSQLVFCDLSTPKKDGTFNVYDDLKNKLVAKGIPEHEVVFIHNADTEAKKKEVFAKVRKGKIRILLGSTQKMGAGTNVQHKLIALHDLDCPWRPSDLEQRLGRIVRQGNKNPVVEVYRYVTEGTFDSYLYQVVENKQKFISQIMTSRTPVRSAEDVDETALSYAEIKALATGNPLIIEKCQLEMDVNKLKILHASHLSQKYALEDKILEYPREMKRLTERIDGYKSDVATLTKNTPSTDTFPPMTVGGISYTKKIEAGKAIIEACRNMTSPAPVTLGEYRGFSMELAFDSFNKEYKVKLCGALSHDVSLGSDIHGNITRIDNVLTSMESKMNNCNASLENTKLQLESAKGEQDRPFPQEQEYSEKSARLKEVDVLLNMNEKDHELLEVEPDDSDLMVAEKVNVMAR